MPFVEHNDVGEFAAEAVVPKEQPAPSLSQTFGSAFRMENDVVATYDFLTRRNDYPADPNFRVMQRIREDDVKNRTNIWENYSDNFLGVKSEQEYLDVMGRINQEQRDREVLERSGAAGVVASIAAGSLSPTMLLPFIGQAKGVKALAQGAAYGALAGAAQEIPLQAAQETRTAGESAFSIAAATVVGGLLGGAVGALRTGEFERIVKSLEADADMVRPAPGGAISNLSSAENASAFAGRLKNARASKVADWLGPVTRVINQTDFRQSSWMMSQLADAGVRLEGNARGIATTEGGTVEANVKTYYGGYAQVAEGLDSNYAKYIFGEGNVPGLAPNIRAGLAGAFDKAKLSKSDFRTEVSRALREGDTHAIPEVAETAKLIRSKIFDPILKEAQRVGIFGEVKVKGDESYLTRMYNHEQIAANPQEFIDILARELSEKLNSDFGERLAKMTEAERRDALLREDLVRPADEVLAEQTRLRAELKALDEGRGAQLVEMEDQIRQLRSAARTAREAGNEEARTIVLQMARELEANAGPELALLRSERSERRRRLQGLSRAAVSLEARQLKKLEQIEKIEDLNQRALERVARKGQRILNRVDQFSDKEMDAEIKELKTLFAEVGARFDAGEERIAKLADGEQVDTVRLLGLEETQARRGSKLTDITDEIEALENVDRFEVRRRVKSALDKTIEQVLGLNERRVLREQKLIEQAAKLDPAEAARRVGQIADKMGMRRTEFIESMRAKGAGDVDLNARTADFSEYAKGIATEIKDKIMGTNVRIPVHELMQGARGPEFARTLDIASNKIEKFLENDVERVIRAYLRTMPADIEIKKKFGDINGTEQFMKMTDELNNRLETLRADMEAQAAKSGKPLDEEKLMRENKRLTDEFAKQHRDLEAVIGRLRGTWGLPDNPDGMAYRMARTVMSLNVLRLMGGTLVASIPDAARPIQRYGLTRTFRDGFLPMINNWKQLQVSAREAKLAGAALDAIIHTRAQAVNDIMDDFGRHSKFERAVEYATNKMGAVALFDYWTVAMKQFSSSVIIGKIGDSLDIVVGGTKASAKELKEAQEFLASKGLTGEYAEAVYKQMTSPKGGARVNGVLMPNTEAWTDENAKRAFRSALASEIDNTIITPGVERPLWMDSSTTGRLLGQFKSFGMSSTFKVLMSGIQQRDMAFANGTMVSLALGALSYYLYAVAAGGETYDKMLKGGANKFADEAIARSGLLGVFSDAQRFLEKIPATQKYVSFSGDRTTRRGGNDMLDVLGGPSLGAAETVAKIVAGIDDPTKSTLHQIRTLMPYQNLIYFRQILDAIEKGAGLPERRN